MSAMHAERTGYMDRALLYLQDVLADGVVALKDVDFDTLVGTGLSGAIVVPSLALALDKTFFIVRKDSDKDNHHGGRGVGQIGPRWVFVDDLISTCDTLGRVMGEVRAVSGTAFTGGSTYVGAWTYGSCGSFRAVTDAVPPFTCPECNHPWSVSDRARVVAGMCPPYWTPNHMCNGVWR